MTISTRRQFLKSALVGGAGAAAVLTGQAALADGHATNHTVEIRGFAYSPANLTIKAGDTVTFVNKDGAPHTATADNRSWDTRTLSRGNGATVTFASAGQHPYFCAIHPSMRGSITVQ